MVRTGREEAERLGIGFGLMLVAIRNLPPADAESLAELAAGSPAAASSPSGSPPTRRCSVRPPSRGPSRSPARRVSSPPPRRGAARPGQRPRGARPAGRARIQHGVRAVEDPELVRRLADEGTVLDVCPSSNVALWVVPRWGAPAAGAAGRRRPLLPQRRRPAAVRARPARGVRDRPHGDRPQRRAARRRGPRLARGGGGARGVRQRAAGRGRRLAGLTETSATAGSGRARTWARGGRGARAPRSRSASTSPAAKAASIRSWSPCSRSASSASRSSMGR